MEHQPNEVIALLHEAVRDPTGDELMLRPLEATDDDFRVLITKWR